MDFSLLKPARAKELLVEFLSERGASLEVAELAAMLIGVILVFHVAFLVNWVAKRLILRVIERVVTKTPWKWDNVLHENRVFVRLSHLAPAAVFNAFNEVVFGTDTMAASFVGTAVQVYVIAVLLMVTSALINTITGYFASSRMGAEVPVKGFAQAVKLIVFLIGGILLLSALFGKSPVFFLSGVGALTAVMLLIFRDALLGLVAGVMISVNQMVRVGDWIEMPGSDANGNVIDVSLTTVKVANWDRTITTIPSYDLISKSFKNWRGMEDSGGRRMKRSLYIDMQTIGFVDEDLLKRLQRIRLLRPYLKEKLKELGEEKDDPDPEMKSLCNRRRLTNIGTFRAYCVAYLRAHANLRQDMIQIVRQLAPGEHGLPLEIYAFTKDIRWVWHEAIQSDIFDHLMAVISEFDLRIFQAPSGYDLKEALVAARPGKTN